MHRPHYRKKTSIAALWKDDKKQLLMLPNSPFEAAVLHTALVNKYGEIKVADDIYHVPTVNPGRRVL